MQKTAFFQGQYLALGEKRYFFSLLIWKYTLSGACVQILKKIWPWQLWQWKFKVGQKNLRKNSKVRDFWKFWKFFLVINLALKRRNYVRFIHFLYPQLFVQQNFFSIFAIFEGVIFWKFISPKGGIGGQLFLGCGTILGIPLNLTMCWPSTPGGPHRNLHAPSASLC